MTPLHWIGDMIRAWLLVVPLPVVRLLFLAVPLLALVGVLLLPNSATSPTGPDEHPRWNLKWGAAIALGIQIAVYWWL